MAGRKYLTAYYVLSSILYGQGNYLVRTKTRPAITLFLGPMALALGIESKHLRKALKWLLANGLLEELTLAFGYAIVRVTEPYNLGFQERKNSCAEEV